VPHILRCIGETCSVATADGKAAGGGGEGKLDGWILIIIAAMRVVFQSLMGRFFLLIEGEKMK
jgi:hypothetical protein